MSTEHRVVIGLDVGTTSVKAVAFGLDGIMGATHHGAVESIRDGDRHELDPAALQDAVRSTLRACVQNARGSEVVAISVVTAMHGLCALDAEQRPLTRILTWADGRASVQAEQLRGSGWHQHTGTPVHPMSPFVKLRWFNDHEPELCRNVAHWVGIKEMVLSWLNGALVVDESSASGSGLLARGTDQWCADALQAVGITSEQLARVVPVTERLEMSAEVAQSFGLHGRTTVVAGTGDGPGASLGVGALSPRIAALSAGTSAALRVTHSAPAPPDDGLFTYAMGAGRWVTGGAISNAGSVMSWLDRLGAQSTTESDPMALAGAAPPGAAGLVMVPHLLPERAPQWDPALAGALLGLRAEHDVRHIARAAFEGVARQLGDLLNVMCAHSPVAEVRGTGGMFGSPLWRVLLAASLDRPLFVLDEIEAGALGAAAVALLAMGEANDLDEAVGRLCDLDANLVEIVPEETLVAAAASSNDVLAARIDELGRRSPSRRQ